MLSAMPAVLYVIAVLEMLGAIVVFAGSLSAIHEILAALMGGFGFMTLALAGILAELRRGRPPRF